ncbi:MAG: hypothetical protein P0116_04770 [Candidatus Nitrosocosmicus sp.]|nr:hypothetical protein [Candidatus Nitrosocosmicus sp.]
MLNQTAIDKLMVYKKQREIVKVYILRVLLRNYLSSINIEAEVISEILLKAASEPEFRRRLIKSPIKILDCYSISNEAKQVIQRTIVDLTQ